MPNSSIDERRHFNRIPMEGVVKLSCCNSEWETRLLDISLKGALLQCPEGFEAQSDDECRVELALEPQMMLITMDGKVVHRTQGNIGFYCEQIDLDSVSHLRRMVELNLGDDSLLERDLAELITGT